MRQLWLQLCRRGDTVAKTAHVCARHFDEGSYHKNLKAELLGRPYKRMLRSEAVPSLHLPSEESVAEVLSQGASKDKRRTYMVPPSSSLSSGEPSLLSPPPLIGEITMKYCKDYFASCSSFQILPPVCKASDLSHLALLYSLSHLTQLTPVIYHFSIEFFSSNSDSWVNKMQTF